MSVTLVKVGFTVTFKVTIESQPVTKLPKVVVCVPPTVNVNPFQEKGSSVSHTVVSVVLVNVGFTVTFKVAKLSQPDTALTKLDVCVPAAVNVNPFQEKGSSVSHTVVSVVLVNVGFTVTFKVAKLSQPDTALTKLDVCVPAAVNVNPFQEKGSSVSHTVVSVVLVKVLFTFKFNVAKLSQPVTKLVNVAVWLSMPLNVKPFHTYGS
jgi:hypothetical protein